MSKTEADGIKKISASFLKKNAYFTGWRSGTITWTRNGWGGEHKSSVGIEVSTMDGNGYLRIHYTQTDRDTNEKKDFDYKIPLTTTPCRYGGKRYWFICPMSKSGVYCGKRVSTLYKDGDFFACRHCYNLTYSSRNQSGRYRGFVSIPDVEEAEKEVKRMYYRGKPTRKYRRYMRLNDKFEMGFIMMAYHFDKKFARSVNPKK
jgi:hypothetical protein